MAHVNGTSTAQYNLPSHFIGGNHLEAAAPSSVKDFVAKHGGHSVISSVSTSDDGLESVSAGNIRN